MRRSFCLISLATNMLEGWEIFHLKGGIHRSFWIVRLFLYDIRELRYKQNKISQLFNIAKCVEVICELLNSGNVYGISSKIIELFFLYRKRRQMVINIYISYISTVPGGDCLRSIPWPKSFIKTFSLQMSLLNILKISFLDP